MFFLSDIDSSNYGRGKDRKKRKQKMSKLGAGLRLATASTVGAGMGTLASLPWRIKYGNKANLIGAGIGAGILGGAAYLDHSNSPYSPIGKKKHKPFPDNHPMRKLMFQDMSHIDD